MIDRVRGYDKTRMLKNTDCRQLILPAVRAFSHSVSWRHRPGMTAQQRMFLGDESSHWPHFKNVPWKKARREGHSLSAQQSGGDIVFRVRDRTSVFTNEVFGFSSHSDCQSQAVGLDFD